MERDALIARLATHLVALASGAGTVESCLAGLREIVAGAAAAGPTPTETSAPTIHRAQLSEQIQAVYEHWRTATGKERARLSPDRAQKIRTRLVQDKFTVDELKLAVDGALASPYHNGENETGTTYLDIRTLFRSCETVEGHIERAGGARSALAPAKDARLQRLEERAEKARGAGDLETYNRLNKELRAALKEQGR